MKGMNYVELTLRAYFMTSFDYLLTGKMKIYISKKSIFSFAFVFVCMCAGFHGDSLPSVHCVDEFGIACYVGYSQGHLQPEG